MNKYTTTQFLSDLKTPYAWPGGYPTFFITSDGGCICHKCAEKEQANIIDSITNGISDGWKVEAHTVNWEDKDLVCDHCGENIESAYGNE